MVRLTDLPDMTLDVYRGRKTTMQDIDDQPIYQGSVVQNIISLMGLLNGLLVFYDFITRY